MPQLLIAMDGTDDGTAARRAANREEHAAAAGRLHAAGLYLLGGPLRHPGEEQVIGSLIVTNFATQEEFDDWLRNEPLMRGGVWQSTQVFDIAIHEKYLATSV
ncbi:YciI family protein [Actinomadura welshii]|uniref:YciI family protein n=1 Tax=Actinomadura welshii TaxID=3103817 RepID=UPI0003AD05BA|nr:YciI family protein [Actinomadura madurae]